MTTPAPPVADQLCNAIGTDAGVGLVIGVDDDLDFVAEHAPLGAVEGKPVQRRERIRRDDRAKPLDHVAVVVVMRRLDEREDEALSRSFPPAFLF
jgi:hypothetical protein